MIGTTCTQGQFAMSISKTAIPVALTFLLSHTAGAQVYESKDAEGNTVFSDTPSAGAQAIDVPTTNTADPVADIPAPKQQAKPEAPPRTSQQAVEPEQAEERDGYIYYGDNDNNNEARERRQEIREHIKENGVPGGQPPVHVQPHPRPASGGGKR